MKKVIGIILAAVLVFSALPLSSVYAEDTATTTTATYAVSGTGYSLTHKSGSYVGTVNLVIKAKKGYKVYYSTSSPIPMTNRILSKKNKKLKITNNTTVYIIAVKSKAKVTQAWLNAAAPYYKKYSYKITNQITFAAKSISSTNKNGVSISNGPTQASVDISKSGTYVLTGSGTETKITVNKKNKSIKKVTLILQNLTISNASLIDDSPVITIGKNTKYVDIKYSGANTLGGPGGFSSAPAPGVIYDKSTGTVRFSRYTGDDASSLTINDSMTEQTSYGTTKPSAGIYAAGKVIFKPGTVTIVSNGAGVRAKKTGVYVDGGDLNVTSNMGSGIYSDKGTVSVSRGGVTMTKTGLDAICTPKGTSKISGGTLTLSGIGGDGIQGKLVDISGGTVSITTAYEYGATDFYDQGMGAARHNTRSSKTEKKITTTTEYINYNTKSHAGILGGIEGYTYNIKSGTMGTQQASGGVNISGGKITIDTLASGTLANNMTSANYVAAEPGLYIIGAPSPAIKSYGSMVIGGGVFSLAAGGNGLECDGSILISKDSDVTVTQAYRGIEGASVTIGTENTVNDTTQVKLYTSGDGICGYSVTKDYEFEDNTLEKYRRTSVSTTNNSVTIYSGYVNVMIDSAKSITGKGAGTLPSNNASSSSSSSSSGSTSSSSSSSGGSQSFLPNGNGINSSGNIDLMGGTTVIYGPHEGKNAPFNYTGKFKIGTGATVLAMGLAGGDYSRPNVEGQLYIAGTIPKPETTSGTSSSGSSSSSASSSSSTSAKTTEAASVKANDSVGIMNSSYVPVLGIKAPKDANYIFYSSSQLKASSYGIYLGGDLSGAINSYTYDGRYQGYKEKKKTTTTSSSSSSSSGSTQTEEEDPVPRVSFTAKRK